MSASSPRTSPLFLWARSLLGTNSDGDQRDPDAIDLSSLCDDSFLLKVWLQIEPSPTFARRCDSLQATRPYSVASRTANVGLVLSELRAFYSQSLCQILVLRMPDVHKIAKMRSAPAPADLEELKHLFLLLLGSAVQCDRREFFIEAIKSRMDDESQLAIMSCINQIVDNPSAVWSKSDWSQLASLHAQCPSGYSVEDMYELLVRHVESLAKERDSLFEKIVEMTVQMEALRPTGSANSDSLDKSNCHSRSDSITSLSSCGITSADKIPHLNVQLQELKSCLRRAQAELEEKNEKVDELESSLKESREKCAKLKQEELELRQEARAAKSLRDDNDVLTERVRKVDRLEDELRRYKDKLNNVQITMKLNEELRDTNRMLSEANKRVEEQFVAAKEKLKKMSSLESELHEWKSRESEKSLMLDLNIDKLTKLHDEMERLRSEHKSALDDLHHTKVELKHVTASFDAVSAANGPSSNLMDALNSDSAKQLIKLELENQRLRHLVDNTKVHQGADKRLSNLSSVINNNNKRYSIDCAPNGHHRDLDGDNDGSQGDDDELLLGLGSMSPESGLSETDSGCASLVGEALTQKLDRIGKENSRLKEELKKSDSRELEDLISGKSRLENLTKELRQQLDADGAKLLSSERSVTKLTADVSRLQRQLDKATKSLEEMQTETSGLEAENSLLQSSAASLKATVRRLEGLERESTQLEAENHKLQQEKKSCEKEISRLKLAIESKDSFIDELTAKSSGLELEARDLRREVEAASAMSARLKELEKHDKELRQELAVNNKSMATLRQELVDEKVRAQQLGCELDQVKVVMQRLSDETSSSPASPQSVTSSTDWARSLEDLLRNVVKKSLDERETRIGELEARLRESQNRNTQMKSELQKRPSDGTTQATDGEAIERRLVAAEDARKNIANENNDLRERSAMLTERVRGLELRVNALSEEKAALQSESAAIQVENSFQKSQVTSLTSQMAVLQAAAVANEEMRDALAKSRAEYEMKYTALFLDHEALQKLNEELNGQYDNLRALHSSLKLQQKALRAEHKSVAEKLQALVVQNDELRKIADEYEILSKTRCTCETASQNSWTSSSAAAVREERDILLTEKRMSQEIYKQLRTESNEQKLRLSEMHSEVEEARERNRFLEEELKRLSHSFADSPNTSPSHHGLRQSQSIALQLNQSFNQQQRVSPFVRNSFATSSVSVMQGRRAHTAATLRMNNNGNVVTHAAHAHSQHMNGHTMSHGAVQTNGHVYGHANGHSHPPHYHHHLHHHHVVYASAATTVISHHNGQRNGHAPSLSNSDHSQPATPTHDDEDDLISESELENSRNGNHTPRAIEAAPSHHGAHSPTASNAPGVNSTWYEYGCV